MKHRRPLAGVCAALVLVCGASAALAAPTPAQRLAAMQKTNARIVRALKTANTRLAATRRTLKTTQATLATTRTQATTLQGQLDAANAALGTAQHDRDTAQAQVGQLQAQVTGLQTQLSGSAETQARAMTPDQLWSLLGVVFSVFPATGICSGWDKSTYSSGPGYTSYTFTKTTPC